MIINDKLLRSECYAEEVPKKRIYLHLTAGRSAMGAVSWWNIEYRRTGDKVATPFVIDRDVNATIYEVFPRKKWAYSLGISGSAWAKAAGISTVQVEQEGLAIEVVNLGPLAFDARNQRYEPIGLVGKGIIVPANQVKRATYRKQEYFQVFTPQQMKSLIWLVRSLCDEFNIPRVVPPPDKRMKFDPVWASRFSGIVAHENFIPENGGKWDMGPAFDWDELQKGIA